MLQEKSDTFMYCTTATVGFYSIDIYLTESDKINFWGVIARMVDFYLSEDEEDA